MGVFTSEGTVSISPAPGHRIFLYSSSLRAHRFLDRVLGSHDTDSEIEAALFFRRSLGSLTFVSCFQVISASAVRDPLKIFNHEVTKSTLPPNFGFLRVAADNLKSSKRLGSFAGPLGVVVCLIDSKNGLTQNR